MSRLRKYFGTDGIRGTANTPAMTADLAMRVGMAAGSYFMRGDHTHRVVIAKDTRLSSYMIENALTAGFLSMGMYVYLVGPLPTPGVAMLTRSMRADLGVMISASHNSYQDNGIKLFAPDGYKLSDEVELAIESLMDNGLNERLVAPDKLGRAKRIDDAQGRYIESVKRSLPKDLRLDGLKIVIDCANGAGYKVGPVILWELGAEVIAIGVEPNGFNINKECGSTHTDKLCAAVIEHGADLGVALDGDADRLVMCDEKGDMLDGDQLMAMVATHWHNQGELNGNGIVSTIMANLGFERYIESLGLTLHRARVGDRYVMEQMKEHGCNIGGEPSGHVILGDHATTGDGLLAALQVLALLVEDGRALSEASALYERMPQCLHNVRFQDENPLESSDIQALIAEHEAKLGDTGRIVTRPSGTEPLIRVMVEGESDAQINAIASNICKHIERAAKNAA